jgi:hypothetical protein
MWEVMPPTEIIEVIVFVAFFIVFIMLRLDPRVPVATSLAALIAIAISIALDNEPLASHLATYSFYFLIMGAILSLVQRGLEKRE